MARYLSCLYQILLILQIVSKVNASGLSDMRSDKFVVPLKNKVNYISVVAELGTPAQAFELLLDTGSSVTWVVSRDNPYCKETKGVSPLTTRENRLIPKGSISCEISGTFNSNDSSTYNGSYSASSLSLKYLDTTTVIGNWAYDRFKIPTLKENEQLILETDDLEIGIGKETNSTIGVLGLGIPEFTFNKENNWIKYEKQNFVTKMRSDKVIHRSLFSIFLNDRPDFATDGELLFGHIDEAKFQAPLYTIKFINSVKKGDPIEKFEVPLTNILINTPTRSNNEDDRKDVGLFEKTEHFKKKYVPSLLDTGSKFVYLPQTLYDTLKGYLVMNYRVCGEVNNHLIVPCSEIDQVDDVKLGFKINDIIFHIPMRSFLERSPNNVSELLKYDESRNLCLLGILPTKLDFSILGQSFFRSLYTVFDLDMMEISIAPAKYSNNRAIKEISIGNSVNGVKVDSKIDNGSEVIVLDPSRDFIEDTRDGFYKYHNHGSSLIQGYKSIILGLSIFLLFIA